MLLLISSFYNRLCRVKIVILLIIVAEHHGELTSLVWIMWCYLTFLVIQVNMYVVLEEQLGVPEERARPSSLWLAGKFHLHKEY